MLALSKVPKTGIAGITPDYAPVNSASEHTLAYYLASKPEPSNLMMPAPKNFELAATRPSYFAALRLYGQLPLAAAEQLSVAAQTVASVDSGSLLGDHLKREIQVFHCFCGSNASGQAIK